MAAITGGIPVPALPLLCSVAVASSSHPLLLPQNYSQKEMVPSLWNKMIGLKRGSQNNCLQKNWVGSKSSNGEWATQIREAARSTIVPLLPCDSVSWSKVFQERLAICILIWDWTIFKILFKMNQTHLEALSLPTWGQFAILELDDLEHFFSSKICECMAQLSQECLAYVLLLEDTVPVSPWSLDWGPPPVTHSLF